MQPSFKKAAIVANVFVLAYLVGFFSAPAVSDIVGWPPPSGAGETSLAQGGRNAGGDLDLSLLNDAYRIVRENFHGFDTVSKGQLVSGMIQGMVDSLGDKHSDYLDLEEAKKFNESLSGDFEWIGAVVEKSDFGVMVKRILAGSPAKEAWIVSGDIISKAGGKKLDGLPLEDAIENIRGPAGTPVELEILRVGEGVPITKTVVRRKITVPSIDGKMIEETKTAYVIMTVYGEKTGFEFAQTYAKLKEEGADSLILDLRDNGGGLLETAVNVLSNFVERDKVLVTTKENDPFRNRSYFSYGPGDISVPVVVLVNENSASASEITAGALKDYGKAVIVGMKTYGKWSVQQPFFLSDGSELKVTVAKWYTPLDHGIDKIGIDPDVEIPFKKEDYEKKYDRQLEAAKDIVSIWKKSGKEAAVAHYRELAEKEKLSQTSASGSVTK